MKQVLSVGQIKHLQKIGIELRNTSMLLWHPQILDGIPNSVWDLSFWSESLFSEDIFEKATAMKFLRNRIRFFRPDGTRGDSPGCGSILIAFGEDNAEILRTCDIAGKYIRIN